MVDIPLPPLDPGVFGHNTVWLWSAGILILMLTRYEPKDSWTRRGFSLLGFAVGGVNFGAAIVTVFDGGSWFTAALHVMAGLTLTVYIAFAFQPDLIVSVVIAYVVFTNFPTTAFENPYVALNPIWIRNIHLLVTVGVFLVAYAISHMVRHTMESATTILRSKAFMPWIGVLLLLEGAVLLLWGVSLWSVIVLG